MGTLSPLLRLLRQGWTITGVSLARGAWRLSKAGEEWYYPIPDGWTISEGS